MKFSFRPAKRGIAQVLGDLESQVMAKIWDRPGSTAREIRRQLAHDKPLAYTTVVTIVDRLYKKGLLTRVRDGKAFRYTAEIDRDQFNQAVTTDVLQGLLKEGSRPIVSTFVDLVSSEPELLEELEERARAKRK